MYSYIIHVYMSVCINLTTVIIQSAIDGLLVFSAINGFLTISIISEIKLSNIFKIYYMHKHKYIHSLYLHYVSHRQ